MFVLPVELVLKLDEIGTHEELRADLVEHSSGMDDVMFVSHTWLRGTHPDSEEGVKLKLLQDLLRSLQHAQVDTHWSAKIAYGLFSKKLVLPRGQLKSCKFVWLDRWSIPQSDCEAQQRGITSIASYIQACRWFLILSGAWRHSDGSLRDLRAWATRGWCRLEQLANALSPVSQAGRERLIICAQSPSSVFSFGPSGLVSREWLAVPVGLGDFTVDADRVALGPVIRRLVERRKASALAEGDLLTFRVLHACASRLLAGTGTAAPLEATPDEWLDAMRFRSARDGAHSGYTPLFFAAFAGGREELVEALLRRRAAPNTRLRFAAPRFGLLKGYSPLHAACLSEQPRVVSVLLAAGADAWQSEANTKSHALHIAAMAGNVANAEVLLAHSPALLTSRNLLGQTPLYFAVLFGHVAYFERFVRRDECKPDLLTPCTMGHSLMNAAVMQVGDLRTLRAVIEHTLVAGGSVDLTAPCRSLYWGALEQTCTVLAKLALCGAPPRFVEQTAYAVRGTALHQAAYDGNLGAVELCLAHGADVRGVVRHSPHRFEPLHLAAMQGHEAITQRLLEAGADSKARDAKGRTPEWWAARRGRELRALHAESLPLSPMGAGHRSWSASAATCAQGASTPCAGHGTSVVMQRHV